MSEEQCVEFKVESTVTFEVFRVFFLRMMCRNKITAFFMKASPYIFITGVFFCLLDKVVFKSESIWLQMLLVVLLMGLFMLLLYYGQPRAVYKSNQNEFSLPYKYIFTQNGFYVGRENFEREFFVPYRNVVVAYEFDNAFYLGYMRKTFILEKSIFNSEQCEFLSGKLKSENPEKYVEIEE